MGSMKVWDGTAWQTASIGPSLPPVTSVDGRTGAVSLTDRYAPLATTPLVQYGASTGTTDANGLLTVFYPAVFGGPPGVVCLTQNQAAAPGAYFTAMHINNTNAFLVRIFNDAGAPVANAAFGYTYVAAGPR